MAPLCPECRTPMTAYEQSGIHLDLCQSCRGLWFDAGELRRIEDTPLRLAPRHGLVARLRVRHCPRCVKQKLDAVNVEGADAIVFDHCDRCRGVFLEAGNLNRVRKLKASRMRRAAANDVRLRRALDERVEEARRGQGGSGIEFEAISHRSDHLTAFLLDLPREEFDHTERTPYVTQALTVAILAVWLWQFFVVPQETWIALATIPRDILAGRHLHTLVTDMFLHGDWFHVLGSLYFFLLFADNVEDRVGSLAFLPLYFAWGIASALISVAMCPPELQDIPQLGASGAISGVTGAYMVLFPKNRIVTPVLSFLAWGIVMKLPAWCYFGFWLGFQFYAVMQGYSGVAWWAHIGGFAAGAMIGLLYRRRTPAGRITSRAAAA